MSSIAGLPADGDLQIRIRLAGLAFEFYASRAAALAFCSEWRQKRSEPVEIVAKRAREARRLPRLPCEQLFYDWAECSHNSA